VKVHEVVSHEVVSREVVEVVMWSFALCHIARKIGSEYGLFGLGFTVSAPLHSRGDHDSESAELSRYGQVEWRGISSRSAL